MSDNITQLQKIVDAAWTLQCGARLPDSRATESVQFTLSYRDEQVNVLIVEGRSKLWFPKTGTRRNDYDRNRLIVLNDFDQHNKQFTLEFEREQDGSIRTVCLKKVRTLGEERTVLYAHPTRRPSYSSS